MFSSVGTLNYDITEGEYRLVVDCDKEISRYYRSMTPKYYSWQPQKWAPHITVVRPFKERPVNIEHWEKYQDEKVTWYYTGYVCEGSVYFWLDAYCKRLEEIRLELGMSISSKFTRPPEGFEKVFHMTLANKKG